MGSGIHYGGIFKLFLSFALGYVVCILARRESGVLKTLGYTIGISILIFSLLYALFISGFLSCALSKVNINIPTASACHMMKK